MRVTLICDASYCHKHKVAGYGFWIASERGKLGGSGEISQEVENNNTAEMMAICNTIWKGVNHNLIQPGDALLIQTDSVTAIGKLRGALPIATEQERAVLVYFDKTVARNALLIEFRHVRGHTSFDGARYAANRMCDMRARRAMRMARSLKMTKKIKGLLNGTED